MIDYRYAIEDPLTAIALTIIAVTGLLLILVGLRGKRINGENSSTDYGYLAFMGTLVTGLSLIASFFLSGPLFGSHIVSGQVTSIGVEATVDSSELVNNHKLTLEGVDDRVFNVGNISEFIAPQQFNGAHLELECVDFVNLDTEDEWDCSVVDYVEPDAANTEI